MLKFTINNKQTIVNNDKKVVTCIIEGYYNLDGIISELYWIAKDDAIKQLREKCKFVGIARCSNCDEFNEQTGYRIAESKAYLALHRNTCTMLSMFNHYLVKAFVANSKLLDKYHKVKAKEYVHLDKLINSTK